ncbi:MAG: D-alanyl-D-alanine carboxypeptidase/D-alanyl-D-alanine-endopeptidase [candidate division Zixibacteria bacterium RBG_16_48_11]|nr:MAG: D-alanyl-D-alanine carboxypeptidase/D-alanyl-D-alanine-endopeptidase [candidate division Zixibacteria bacterium RBG_16_48_11]
MLKREGMIAGLVMIFCWGGTVSASPEEFQIQVSSKIDSILALPEIASANCGVAIYSLQQDRFLYEKNSHKLFMPASNLKLVTTAAGLHYLGENFQFKTEFYYTGQIRKGKLEGDLIVKGYGDPTTSNRFGGTVTGILEQWADSLKFYGIYTIQGKILTDEIYFDSAALGPAWSWDDLSYWYGAEVSALNFNDNCVNLYFKPGGIVGTPAQIRFEPETDFIQWQNLTVTVPAGSDNTLDFYRQPNSNQVAFYGSYPINQTEWEEEYVSVNQPSRFCVYVLQEILKEKQIEVKSEKSKFSQYAKTLLFSWRSHPLSEIIAVVNKRSQNLYAECLLKALGKEIKGEGSFAAGAAVLSEYLINVGIPQDQFKIYDGSGLSYLNLLSPYAVVKLLAFVRTQPYFRAYYESLAIPGEDKSVITRMNGIEGKEKMRLKTGFIGNAICLSGYISDKADELYAVSIMFNNYSSTKQKLWEIQDKICELLATYSEQ